MKVFYQICIAVLFLVVLFAPSSAQQKIECSVTASGPPTVPMVTGTLRPIVIYCVNVGENSVILPQLLQVDTLLSDYFERATFGNYHVQMAAILRQDSTHAFVSRVSYDGTSFIVQANFARDILQQADSLYDFSQFDANADGFVDYVIFVFLNYAGFRGTVGLPNDEVFTTHDPDPHHPGQFIKIDGTGYLTGSNRAISGRKDMRDLVNGAYDFIGGWVHELGHSLFNFPDMNHGGFSPYNHYSIGGFDAMAGGGFQNVESPYNPWFCEQRTWGAFATVTNNTLPASLTDFYAGGTAYRFAPALPAGAASNQKFLVTYHQKLQSNQWTFNWPVDANNGGILIWHIAQQGVNLSDYYGDRTLMPIDVEAAHGKFNWTEDANGVYNTGVANPSTGFDSLEIRKIGVNSGGQIDEIQGPYFRRDHGSASIFFVPNSGRVFTPTSNPNSAFYRSTSSHAQDIYSSFSVQNIVRNGGVTSADILVATPPSVPTLAWPSNGQGEVPLSPTLTWNAALGAASYAVQVSTDPSFTSLVVNESGITGTSFSANNLSYATTYWWRVNATNAGGTSAWTTIWSFTTIDPPPGPPTLVSPGDGAQGLTLPVTLQWSTVTYANSYEVQWDTSPSFSGASSTQIGSTSYAPPGLSYATTYYWRARGIGSSGAGDWSASYSFTVWTPVPSTPQLSSPTDGSTNLALSVQLSWQTSIWTDQYEVQYAANSAFSGATSVTTSGNGIAATPLSYSTTYYWRVKAMNNYGQQSSWSSAWQFTTMPQPLQPPPAPNLVSPSNGATDASVRASMNWQDPSSSADYFMLQWGTSSNFTDTYSIGGTSYSPSLTCATGYFWRVQTHNQAGFGPWSGIWSFTTRVCPLPRPPSWGFASGNMNDAQVNRIEMNWENIGDPYIVSKYKVFRCPSGTYTWEYAGESTRNGFVDYPPMPPYISRWDYYVRMVDHHGQESGVSPTWTGEMIIVY